MNQKGRTFFKFAAQIKLKHILCTRWSELVACILSMNSGCQSWAFFHLETNQTQIKGRINYLAFCRSPFLLLYFQRWPPLAIFPIRWGGTGSCLGKTANRSRVCELFYINNVNIINSVNEQCKWKYAPTLIPSKNKIRLTGLSVHTPCVAHAG